MRKPDLTFPELMFVVATRGMLAAGAALLIAGRLSEKQRRLVGGALVAIGAVTTVPALMAVIGSRDRSEARGPERDKQS